MLKNYWKLALRNLQKQKAFTAINILGLSVGIAFFALLLLFASNEYGFDRFHRYAPDIYRVYSLWDQSLLEGREPQPYVDDYWFNGKEQPIAPALKQFFPEVQDFTHVQLAWGEILVRTGNKTIRAEWSYTEPSFFSIFDFPLVAGQKAAVLQTMSDAVITESRAVQLFGSVQNAVGHTIEVLLGTKFFPFTVSGVVKDPPVNSTIRFDIIGPWKFTTAHRADDFEVGNNWHPTVRMTYIQLQHGSRLAKDPQQLTRFQRSFTPPTAWKDLAGDNWKKNIPPVTLHLQPLLDIHTDTWFNGWEFTDYQRIDPQTLWILLGIATGILLIACINFTTLAIARSAARSKEVGVRKVIGAAKAQIIFQFLSEAILLSAVSAALGLALAYLLLPEFNHLANRQLQFSLIQYPQLFLLLACVAVLAGILAGSYPALVLARFRPVEVLKNKIRIGGANLFTRSLVTFQFALSIAFIGSTVVILQQTNFMLAKSPGFDKENIIAIDASQTDPDKTFPVFRQSLLVNPLIIGVTSAGAGMGAGKGLLGYSDKGINADVNIIDTNYIKVFGMHLLAGSNIRSAAMNDSLRPLVINETFMHAMGWNLNNAVGQLVRPFQGNIGIVTGVVKNFNYESLGQLVRNQLFISTPDRGFVNFYVRLRPGDPAKALALLTKAWHDVAPAVPLKYSFLDEDIKAFYQSEQTWTRIVAIAAGVSILLACLGLLGLASLAAVNRRKEVGVRKVLGASVPDLVLLLSKEFLVLVGIAFLIATPATWLWTHHWLQGYANRIDLNPAILLLAGLTALLTALLATGLQALKAANTNPIQSLRSE